MNQSNLIFFKLVAARKPVLTIPTLSRQGLVEVEKAASDIQTYLVDLLTKNGDTFQAREFDSHDPVDILTSMVSYSWGSPYSEWVRSTPSAHLAQLVGPTHIVLDESDNRTGDVGRFVNLIGSCDRIILFADRLTLKKYNRGVINKDRFVEAGLSEQTSRKLISYLRQQDLLKATGFFNWKDDFESHIDAALAPDILPSLFQDHIPVIRRILHATCALYRETSAARLEQELSILQNQRWLDLTRQGSVVVCLLDGTPQTSLPALLQALPPVAFNQAIITNDEWLTIFTTSQLPAVLHGLQTQGVIQYTQEGTELTPRTIAMLGDPTKQDNLNYQLGPHLVRFIKSFQTIHYPNCLLRLIENLQFVSTPIIADIRDKIDRRRRWLMSNIRPTSVSPHPRHRVQVPLSHLPSKNQNFVGRQALIDRIEGCFQTQCRVVLTGMGGVGKSQLAKAVAYRTKDKDVPAFWINAETGLNDGFRMIAKKLGIKITGLGPDAIREFVKAKLKSVSRFLLVFDNVDDYTEIEPYLPETEAGQWIMLTSRLRRLPETWSAEGHIDVPVFSEAESLEYIYRFTCGWIRPSQFTFEVWESELESRIGPSYSATKATACQLATELGDLPLALIKAVSFIGKTGSVEDYIRLFRREKLALLDEASSIEYQDQLGESVFTRLPGVTASQSSNILSALRTCKYIDAQGRLTPAFSRSISSEFQSQIAPHLSVPIDGLYSFLKALDRSTLISTWRISFDAILKAVPEASQLLPFLGHLSTDNIPKILLAEILKNVTGDETQIQIRTQQILDCLVRYSVVDIDRHLVSIHRLMQLAIRSETREKNHAALTAIIAASLDQMMDIHTAAEETARCADLVAHIVHILHHPLSTTLKAILTTKLGEYYLYQNYAFGDAEHRLQSGLALYQRETDPINVAICQVSLGFIQIVRYSNFHTAEQLVREAKAVLDTAEDSSDFRLTYFRAMCFNNFGVIALRQGKYHDALTYHIQAKSLRETPLLVGRTSISLAVSKYQIGKVNLSMFNLDEAERWLTEAETELRRSDDLGQSELAFCLHDLGNICYLKRDYESAMRRYEEALALNQKIYGFEEHPLRRFFSIDEICMANVRAKQGLTDEAHQTYRRIKEDVESGTYTFGKYLISAAPQRGLGNIAVADGRLLDGLRHYFEALEIYKSLIGEGVNHPFIAATYYSIHVAYSQLSKESAPDQPGLDYQKMAVEMYQACYDIDIARILEVYLDDGLALVI